MTIPASCCGYCRFFLHIENGLGECRRRAPKAGTDADSTAIWPEVAKSFWCGEHEYLAPSPHITREIVRHAQHGLDCNE